jgi:hypothetical protein
VLQRYLQRRGKRGAKKLPSDFPKQLEFWLSELTTDQGTKMGGAYWTEKGYALAHEINLHPFMAWFRALEEVAMELYPDRVPFGRRNRVLTGETIEAVRADYLKAEYFDRNAVKNIAAKYGIGTFRVGQLCRKEKQRRKEEFDHAQQEEDQGANVATASAKLEPESTL